MKKDLTTCNNSRLLSNPNNKYPFVIGAFYRKFARFNTIIFARGAGIPLLLAWVALFVAGCQGPSEHGQTVQKKAETEEVDVLGDMPDESVAEKRAKREALFHEEVKDPFKSPIEDPNETEKAPAEHGYGLKTPAQVAGEKPRQNRIGVLAPLVGDLELFGKATMDGAEMASDEINERGGIRKQQFDLLVYDTKASMDGARDGVKHFVMEEIAGMVGAPTGEVSFSASKAINENQISAVSAGSRRRLGDTGPYNFRVTLNDSHGIKVLMEYVTAEKKFKRYAVFTSLVNDFSIQLSAAFKREIQRQNAQLTEELYLYNVQMSNISKEEESIPAQLKKLAANPPDALIYTGDAAEGAEIVREMRKMGLKTPVIGGEDLMKPEYLALAEKGEGTLTYGGFNPDSENPRVKKFVEGFKKRFKQEPSRVAALAYDAYYILALGMEKAESMRPYHIRESLMGIKDFKGVTGAMSMGKDREAVKDPFIFEMRKKGGKFSFVALKEPL